MSLITKCKSKSCPFESECVRKKTAATPSKMWDFDYMNKDFMGQQKLKPEDIKEKKDCRYFYPR